MAKPKNKVGRPTSLDQSTREQLLAAISDGMPIRRAATLVGVHHSNVYKLADAEPEFRDALKKARSAFEAFHLRKIGRDESWQSSAWLLERIHHKRYAKREAKPPATKPDAYFEADKKVDAASPPPGTVPALPPA